MRQVEITDRDLGGHAGRAALAEDLDDATHRRFAFAGLLHDLRDHHLPRPRSGRVGQRDQHVLVDTVVVGHDQGDAAFLDEVADHAAVGALEDLPHGPFAAAPRVDADHRGQDAVAVEHRAHLARRQVQVGLAVFGHHEAIAVGMGRDAPGDQVHLGSQAVGSAPVLHHLAVAQHGLQAPPEDFTAVVADDVQPLHDVALLQGPADIFEQRDDLLTIGRFRVDSPRTGALV